MTNMGKSSKGLRKYTKGRGSSTWKKGQSSSSNPQCMRHRDAAKAGYYAFNTPNAKSTFLHPAEIATPSAVADGDMRSRAHSIRSTTSTQIESENPFPSFSSIRSAKNQRFRKNSTAVTTDFDMDDDDEISDTESRASSAAPSMRSHVSDWTRCTNPTFERFLERWSVNSTLHREMLSILASATEVIAEKNSAGTKNTGKSQHCGSNTEYFALFLASLSNATADNVVACLALASIAGEKLPISVRRAKFGDVTRQVVQTLHMAANSELLQNSPLFFSSGVKILGAFLQCQDDFTWSQPATVQVFDTTLHLLLHAKPKVRKTATHAAATILREVNSNKSHATSTSEHPAVARAVIYIREKLNDCLVTNNESGLLQLLGIVQHVLPHFPPTSIRPLIEFCLRLIGHGQVMLALVALKTLQSLFPTLNKRLTLKERLQQDDEQEIAHETKRNNIPYDTAAQLFNALYEHQPNATAAKIALVTKWLALQASILSFLIHMRFADGIKHAPHFVRVCAASIWQLQQQVPSDAHDAAANVLVHLFSTMPTETTNTLPPIDVVKSIADTLQPCLMFPFHMTWKPVTLVCGAVLDFIGSSNNTTLIKFITSSFNDDVSILMAPILQGLADMRRQPQCSCIADIDKTLGAAIRALGPEFVLQALPLKYGGGGDSMSFEGTWILPIISKTLSAHAVDVKPKVKLASFIREFVPLLQIVEHAIKTMKSASAYETDSLYANLRACQSIEAQTWSLLAVYCRCCSDLDEQFGRHFAQRLGDLLLGKPELHMQILAALRAAVLNVLDDDADVANRGRKEEANVMSRYAKNYLPRLFSIYTDTSMSHDKSRLPALETIKLYLRVAPRALASSVLRDILRNKLLDEKLLMHDANKKPSATPSTPDTNNNWVQKNAKFYAVLDLVIALVPYATNTSDSAAGVSGVDTNAKALVGLVVALLNSNEIVGAADDDAGGRFKKACRLMEELFRANCASVRQLKTAVLSVSTQKNAATSANKAPWLRCVRYLLVHSYTATGVNRQQQFDADLVRKLLPLVVPAHKELNVKSRAAASAVVLTMAEQYVSQTGGSDAIVRLDENLAKNQQPTRSELLDEFIDYILHAFFSYPNNNSTSALSVNTSCAALLAVVGIICRFNTIMSPLTTGKLVEFLCEKLSTAQTSIRGEQKRLAQLRVQREAELKHKQDALKKLLAPSATNVANNIKQQRGIRRINPTNNAAATQNAITDDADMADDDNTTENQIQVEKNCSEVPSAELRQFYSVAGTALLVFNAIVLKVPVFGAHVVRMVAFLYGNVAEAVLNSATREHFRRKLNELTTRMLRKYDYNMLLDVWPEEQRKLLSTPRKRERQQQAKKHAEDEKQQQSSSLSSRKKIGKKQRAHLRMQDRAAQLLLLGDDGAAAEKQQDMDDDDDDEEEQDVLFEDDEFLAHAKRRRVEQKLRESSDQIVDFLEPQTMWKRLY